MKNLLTMLMLMCFLSGKSQLYQSKDLYKGMVLIADEKENSIKHGSAFMLTKDNRYYLVTARHNVANMDINTTNVYLSYHSDKAVSYRLMHLYFRPTRFSMDEKSDGLVIELEPFDAQCLDIFKNVALDAALLNSATTSLDHSLELLMMGYPIYDRLNFYPITNRATIASPLMSIQMDDNTPSFMGYYLENLCMQGMSGAPVFSGVKDRSIHAPAKTTIIGMVTGNSYDGTGAGYSIITPASYIKDLIDKMVHP